jgi:hypothetical protein
LGLEFIDLYCCTETDSYLNDDRADESAATERPRTLVNRKIIKTKEFEVGRLSYTTQQTGKQIFFLDTSKEALLQKPKRKPTINEKEQVILS